MSTKINKILQLCCFTNLWSSNNIVESIDLKLGKDIFDVPVNAGKDFDLVVAAPPCDQFTKSNQHNWQINPIDYIKIALRCLEICEKSGRPFVLENPPGRITKLIKELEKYRIGTWSGNCTNKEYVIYSNMLIPLLSCQRYGKKCIKRQKKDREAWQPDFVEHLEKYLL